MFEHLHSNRNIIYRDLKPENLIIDQDGYLKLIDSGYSKKMNNVHSCRTFTVCGSPEYLAPEMILNDHGHNKSVDWWGLGILIYAMIAGTEPFTSSDVMLIY